MATLVLDDGKFTGARPGRVIRGPGFERSKAPYAVATGKLDESFKELDELIRTFIEQNRVPGAGVAVTDQGRLVFARGYGYADIAKQKPVEPTSVFRIASISKPITAVAIMQLVEQGKLKLEDRVLEILKYEPHLAKGRRSMSGGTRSRSNSACSIAAAGIGTFHSTGCSSRCGSPAR